MVKNLLANAGDIGDMGSIPVSGRSPGGGHSNPLQDSCLENPMDRGACQATVLGSQRVDRSNLARAHTQRICGMEKHGEDVPADSSRRAETISG